MVFLIKPTECASVCPSVHPSVASDGFYDAATSPPRGDCGDGGWKTDQTLSSAGEIVVLKRKVV